MPRAKHGVRWRLNGTRGLPEDFLEAVYLCEETVQRVDAPSDRGLCQNVGAGPAVQSALYEHQADPYKHETKRDETQGAERGAPGKRQWSSERRATGGVGIKRSPGWRLRRDWV